MHTLPARHERKAGRDQMLVVTAGVRIDEMHRGEIAFTAPRRRNAAETSDRERARHQATLGERTHHHVERDVVAAHDHQVGRARRGCR